MKTLFLLVALVMVSTVSARTWTSSDGRSIEGELIAKTKTDAVIQRADGVKVTVPIASLSVEDRKFIRESTVAAPAATLKEGLQKFFSKTRNAGSLYTIDSIVQPGGEKFAYLAQNSQTWTAELKQLEALVDKENVRDKALLIDMRRAADLLTKAQADKSHAAEAVRALVSLKTSASR